MQHTPQGMPPYKFLTRKRFTITLEQTNNRLHILSRVEQIHRTTKSHWLLLNLHAEKVPQEKPLSVFVDPATKETITFSLFKGRGTQSQFLETFYDFMKILYN